MYIFTFHKTSSTCQLFFNVYIIFEPNKVIFIFN